MDPTAETLTSSLVTNPVPRRMPIPERPAGPPPVFASIVAAPVVQRAQELADPIAAQISETIRGLIEGTPEAVADIIDALPSPGTVLTLAGLGLGVASLGAGVSGEAAKLLAAPTAGVPYLGAAVAAWGAAAPIASAVLGAVGAGYGALGQTLNGVANPVDFSALTAQWGQLIPSLPGAPTPSSFPDYSTARVGPNA